MNIRIVQGEPEVGVREVRPDICEAHDSGSAISKVNGSSGPLRQPKGSTLESHEALPQLPLVALLQKSSITHVARVRRVEW